MDDLEQLAIFPLPNLVLLPGELLPLHVFEPRYREMVAWAQARDARIAMATLREDDVEAEVPRVHPEVGIGKVVRIQTLPDGRSNLLLSYERAARIESELAVDTSFRQVHARPIAEVDPSTYPDPSSVQILAMQVAARLGPLGGRERLFTLEGQELVDGLAVVFVRNPVARRAYLVAEDGAARLRLVERALLELLSADPGGPAAEA